MRVDYLIVGQGIAGTGFAEHVIQSGKSLMVIDDPTISNSSKVAGGLYNPITGRKMVKTWNCDKLFNYLIPFYKALEDKLEANFLFEKPIYRPFYSIEELNEWMGKSADPNYEPYIDAVLTESTYGQDIKDQFGGIRLRKSGYLGTNQLIELYREYLIKSSQYFADRFDFSALKVNNEGISYKHIRANRIVFCDGRLLNENPFFNRLPLRPVKGELLFIKTKHRFETIYNRGVFVIPVSEGFCKVGATYDHENLGEEITSKAKNELIRRLEQLALFDYEVVDQKAGVRPATKDRKPFVGVHPEFKNIVVFNGMGAKGVSLVPFYAKQLLNHLENGDELDNEVNIERFFSLF